MRKMDYNLHVYLVNLAVDLRREYAAHLGLF